MSPQRIQLSRAKGWRKPEEAVVVSRPSRWGNPYSVADYGLPFSLRLYEEVLSGSWNPGVAKNLTDDEYRVVVDRRDAFRKRLGYSHPIEAARYQLAGRDLACWCPLNQACHADVLIEVANR